MSNAAAVHEFTPDSITSDNEWLEIEDDAEDAYEAEEKGVTMSDNGDTEDIEKEIENLEEEAPKEEKIEKEEDIEKEEKEPLEAKEEEEEESKESKEELYEVKVDGKVEEISLQELKNNYSGKVAYDKKFSEMDTERQSFKKEVQDINSYVSELGKTMKENSVLEGFYKVGEMVNMPAHAIKAALIKEILPELERLEGMSQEGIDLEYQQNEIKYLKEKTESDRQKFETEQAQKELSFKISQARETLGVDNSEWEDAVAYLDKSLPPEESLTIDTVKEYIQFSKSEDIAKAAIDQFDSSYLGNEEVIENLQDIIIKNPDFTDSDIQDILVQAFGSSKKEVAEEKIVETVSKKQSKVNKSVEQENSEIKPIVDQQGEEILDWDDI